MDNLTDKVLTDYPSVKEEILKETKQGNLEYLNHELAQKIAHKSYPKETITPNIVKYIRDVSPQVGYCLLYRLTQELRKLDEELKYQEELNQEFSKYPEFHEAANAIVEYQKSLY